MTTTQNSALASSDVDRSARPSASNGRPELAISAHGLVQRFGDFEAVRGIDLEVRRGESFGVLGPNGAGKTTTLNRLATPLPITAGGAEGGGQYERRQRAERQPRTG